MEHHCPQCALPGWRPKLCSIIMKLCYINHIHTFPWLMVVMSAHLTRAQTLPPYAYQLLLPCNQSQERWSIHVCSNPPTSNKLYWLHSSACSLQKASKLYGKVREIICYGSVLTHLLALRTRLTGSRHEWLLDALHHLMRSAISCCSINKGRPVGKIYDKGRYLVLCHTKSQRFSQHHCFDIHFTMGSPGWDCFFAHHEIGPTHTQHMAKPKIPCHLIFYNV